MTGLSIDTAHEVDIRWGVCGPVNVAPGLAGATIDDEGALRSDFPEYGLSKRGSFFSFELVHRVHFTNRKMCLE